MTNRRARLRADQALQDAVLRTGRTGSDKLDRLLADACAPAHADELTGRVGALNAFTHNRPSPRRHPVQALLIKLLAAKALAAVASGAAIGGVALAAATGSLPAPLQTVAHDTVGAPAASRTDATETADGTETPEAVETSDATETPDATQTPHATETSDATNATATPSPNLMGLCRAYSAGVATAKGKALDNPAFTVLITAAGGKDATSAYCTNLLATAPGGKPTTLPTQAKVHKHAQHPTGAPTTHPTGAPTTHPTGAPTKHPTGAPTKHPTGAPTTHPTGGPAAHPTGRP